MTDDANSPEAPGLDRVASGPEPNGPAPDAAGSVVAPDAGPAVVTAPQAFGEPEPPIAAPVYRPRYLFLAVVSLTSLAADLLTKAWAKQRLEDVATFAERRIVVVQDHLQFVYARNKGGAWGLLQNEPESIRRPFFLGISVVAIIFIVSLYRKLTPDQTALRWGLPLVLGGAIGNLVNRIQYNYVIDFIDAYVGSHHWPTFNVADIAICVGVGLMAVDMFTSRKPAVSPTATP